MASAVPIFAFSSLFISVGRIRPVGSPWHGRSLDQESERSECWRCLSSLGHRLLRQQIGQEHRSGMLAIEWQVSYHPKSLAYPYYLQFLYSISCRAIMFCRTSPFHFYQFWKQLPDADAEKFLPMFSLRSMEEVRCLTFLLYENFR